jgi:hypothetical protein
VQFLASPEQLIMKAANEIAQKDAQIELILEERDKTRYQIQELQI